MFMVIDCLDMRIQLLLDAMPLAAVRKETSKGVSMAGHE